MINTSRLSVKPGQVQSVVSAALMRCFAVAHGTTPGATASAVLLVALCGGACGSNVPGHAGKVRDAVGTTSVSADPSTIATTTVTTGSGPVLTPYPTTTIVNWGRYSPSYDTIAQLFADSDSVFIATVDPFVADDPTPGTTFAPFDLSTSRYLFSPPTPPEIIPGIPQGQPGDTPVTVGHRYLIFFGVDYSDDLVPKTCIVGGQRGLFDYNSVAGTVTRTDGNTASHIPKTLTLAQMTAEIRVAQAATATNVGSSSDPEKWPPPPVCALSATES